VLRTVGVGFGIEHRFALARSVREDARTDQARIGSINRLEMIEIRNRSYA
jgi:hypothetical protein